MQCVMREQEASIASRPARLQVLSAMLQNALDPGASYPEREHSATDSEEGFANGAQDGAHDDDALMGGNAASEGMVSGLRLRTLLAVSVEEQCVLRSMLVRLSHSCDNCSSGNEVRVMISSTHLDRPIPYDCLLLDYKLLGKQALKVVADMHTLQRRASDRKRLIIIGLVQADDTSQQEAFLAAGVDAVIFKPMTQLKVQHALSSGASAASTRLLLLNKAGVEGVGTSASVAHIATAATAATADASALVTTGGKGSSGTAAAEMVLDDQVKRVLVVEDDPGQQRVLKSFLSKDGFEVEVAKDGAAGVVAIQQSLNAFDLVLIKGVMAGKAGWEVAAEVHHV